MSATGSGDDLERHLRAAAKDLDDDGAAGLEIAEGERVIVDVGDRVGPELHDHVAGLQACALGGRVGAHAAELHARAGERVVGDAAERDLEAAARAAVWIGRRSILSTRINRRLVGLVAISGLGALAQRVVGALAGLDMRETVLQNFVLVFVVCITGGVTLHWGFFWSAGALGVGLIIAVLLPGSESQVFGLAGIGALVFAVLSWRGWKGEFSLKPRE